MLTQRGVRVRIDFFLPQEASAHLGYEMSVSSLLLKIGKGTGEGSEKSHKTNLRVGQNAL